MSEFPSWLKVDHWYHVFVLFGAAGTLTALTVEFQELANAHAVLFFLGMFFIGLGEWTNHPLQTTVLHPGLGQPGGIITGHPRNANFVGVPFDFIGIALAATAAYRIAQSL